LPGYLLPNDEAEADRLDLMHEMSLTIMDRKLHLAPLDPSIQRALDIGTGTGIVSYCLVPSISYAFTAPLLTVW
jgi:methylase of polypeptide subunit release factors